MNEGAKKWLKPYLSDMPFMLELLEQGVSNQKLLETFESYVLNRNSAYQTLVNMKSSGKSIPVSDQTFELLKKQALHEGKNRIICEILQNPDFFSFSLGTLESSNGNNGCGCQ